MLELTEEEADELFSALLVELGSPEPTRLESRVMARAAVLAFVRTMQTLGYRIERQRHDDA